MITICVGPDCAGKTSMVEELVAMYVPQLKKWKVSPPFTEEDYDAIIAALEEQLRDAEEDIIWDRIPIIDDLVYSHIMDRRKSYYEMSGQLKKITELLRQCMIIYVYAEPTILIERAKERAGENDKYMGHELNIADLRDIQNEYKKIFNMLDIGACVYDIDTSHMNKKLAYETLIMLYYKRGHQVKSQKIAHIVPKNNLYMTRDNQYHMCLAQYCFDDAYAAFFRRRAAEGKFVLLDNGAAEGESVKVRHLFEKAVCIGAREVILPDVLQNSVLTIQRTKDAYDKYLKFKEEKGYKFNIMIVPQGANYDQWKRCAEQMVEMFPEAACYGVPKILATKEDLYARFYAVEYLCELLMAKGRDAEIHLLGMNEPPAVISSIFEAFPRVRGIDSAFAYLCTQALIPISNPYVERVTGTIDFLRGKVLGEKLDINMQLMNLYINHNSNSVDYTWGK